ncbi:MAG: polysaccharide pyruvyl transferase family protein [Bacteroidota bacterium]
MTIIEKIRRYYKECYTMNHYPSWQEILKKEQNIYAYYGYLGDGNYGDELVFEATRKLFQPNLLLPIKRRMPLEVKYLKNKKNLFSGIIIGGGTLVGPFWEEDTFRQLQERENLPVFIHGVGVREEIEEADAWRDIVFVKNFFGGVRGLSSQENLTKLYQDIKIVGDAALFLFDQQSWEAKAPRKIKNILINLGTHHSFKGESNTRAALKNFIRFLLDNNYNVSFLPMHNIDYELGKNLSEVFPSLKLYDIPTNYEDTVKLFAEYDCAIGERLHFMVLAVILKIPFLSIKYSSKHADLLNSLKLGKYGLVPEDLSVEKLKTAFSNLAHFQWENTSQRLQLLKKEQLSEYIKFTSTH